MILNKNYETELSLKDLLFGILYKWWAFLLIGIIAAGISGYKEYWSFEKYHRIGEMTPAEVQYQIDIEANKRALEQAEKALSEFDALARDNKGGREVSILMGIDPTNIWTAEKKYYLDVINDQAASDDRTSSDISNKILVTLSEAFSVEINDELLVQVFGTNLRSDIDQVTFIYSDPDRKTLSVFGLGGTKDEAIRRKEFADSYLLDAYKQLSKKEQFTLEVIADSIGTKTKLLSKKTDGTIEEEDLMMIQNTIRNNYQTYLNQSAAYTQNRDALRAQIIIKPEPKIITQALIGFAIGVFIAIALFIAYYLFCGKIKTARELKNRYDLSLLGEFTHSRALWKGKGIDWVIEKLEFGKKTNIENEMDSIAYLIDEAKDGKTVLLTGTLEEKRMRKIFDELASRLKTQGIELVFEPDYLHNSEAVAASRDLDSVLLVEEKYKSRIRDLNRMAEMLTIEDANVIGAILI